VETLIFQIEPRKGGRTRCRAAVVVDATRAIQGFAAAVAGAICEQNKKVFKICKVEYLNFVLF
jgi:hypothetical protein